MHATTRYPEMQHLAEMARITKIGAKTLVHTGFEALISFEAVLAEGQRTPINLVKKGLKKDRGENDSAKDQAMIKQEKEKKFIIFHNGDGVVIPPGKPVSGYEKDIETGSLLGQPDGKVQRKAASGKALVKPESQTIPAPIPGASPKPPPRNEVKGKGFAGDRASDREDGRTGGWADNEITNGIAGKQARLSKISGSQKYPDGSRNARNNILGDVAKTSPKTGTPIFGRHTISASMKKGDIRNTGTQSVKVWAKMPVAPSPDVPGAKSDARPATPRAGIGKRGESSIKGGSPAAPNPVADGLPHPKSSDAGPDMVPLKPDIGGIMKPLHPGGGGIQTVSPGMIATSVAIQIAQSTKASTGHLVEISLDPAELGKVRLRLHPTENGMQVQIIADRPDTIDLMRRNTASLVAEFQGLGYRDVGFSFAHSGQGHPDRPPKSFPALQNISTKAGQRRSPQWPDAKPPEDKDRSLSSLDVRF